MDILYKCDRRACEKCNFECDHTHDILHAKNFEKVNDAFFEIDTKRPLIFKLGCIIREEKLESIHQKLLKEVGSGIVLLPSSITVDGDVYEITKINDRKEVIIS